LPRFMTLIILCFTTLTNILKARFGLSPLGAISPSNATDRSSARILQLQQAIADQRVNCVFSEPQFNTGIVDDVIGRSLVDLIVIDPLGTTTEMGENLYVELLRTRSSQMAGC
jgi:zinc transport system substrate-binding protein